MYAAFRHRITASSILALLALVLATSACDADDESLGLAWIESLSNNGVDCELVGQWEQPSGMYETVITICRDADGYRLHHAWGEGSPLRRSSRENVFPLFLVPEGPGVRFRRSEHITDYYTILEDGRLEVGNERYVLYIAQPIR